MLNPLSTEIDYTNSPKEIIAELQQRVDGQNQLIQNLEDRIVSLNYKFEQVLQERKRSVPPQQDDTEQQRIVTQLRRELHRIQQYEEQMGLQRANSERLNRGLTTLEAEVEQLDKKIEERTESMAYIREQRQVDSRRVNEFQAELSNLERKIENNLLNKIRTVEQRLPQYAQFQLALENMREETQQQREQSNYQLAERERQMKTWIDQSMSYEQKMSKYAAEIEKFNEQYQTSRRALESLQDLQERLQRTQHEAAELQRLNDERQRTLFEKWQKDYTQRLQHHSQSWRPAITEVERTVSQFRNQMMAMQKNQQTVQRQLEIVLQILEEDVQYRTTMLDGWQRRFIELASTEV